MAFVLALAQAVLPLSLLWVVDGPAPIGVSVPRARLEHPVVRYAVAKARAWLMWCALASAVATAVLVLVSPQLIPVATIATMVLIIMGWNRCGQRIRAVKRAEDWYADVPVVLRGDVVDSEEEELPVNWWGFWCAGAIVMAGASYLGARWDEVPGEFATHFDAHFQPDAWSTKSVGSVFFGMFFAVGLLLFLGALAWIVRVAPSSSRTAHQPESRKQAAKIRASTASALGWMSAYLCAGLVCMQLSMCLPDWHEYQKLISVLFLIGTVAGAVAMTVSLARISGGAKRGGVGAYGDRRQIQDMGTEPPDMDSHVVWGMFYYNPDDPAIFVEKRLGVGWDFNYGRWPGKIFALFTVLILIATLAVALF
ncbi:DUF5808 domain-containing protein [Corynebacterium epidermidicanis]|nr:DUF5808 domain-containing protein [Corynebacterium epidermidicanis]